MDGTQDPAKLRLPQHEPNGTLNVLDGMGIVFVLLPGRLVTLGCQNTDSTRPHFDPRADVRMAPAHEVVLDPFLMARTEVTQGLWKRLWERGGKERTPSTFPMGRSINSAQELTEHNPVENVSWHLCRQLLDDHGLHLPTEAQW